MRTNWENKNERARGRRVRETHNRVRILNEKGTQFRESTSVGITFVTYLCLARAGAYVRAAERARRSNKTLPRKKTFRKTFARFRRRIEFENDRFIWRALLRRSRMIVGRVAVCVAVGLRPPTREQ